MMLAVSLLQGCANSKSGTTKEGRIETAEPYGWANYQTKKNPNFVYEVNLGNVVWSIILVETIVVPVWLTGWDLYEPIEPKK